MSYINKRQKSDRNEQHLNHSTAMKTNEEKKNREKHTSLIYTQINIYRMYCKNKGLDNS
jgi:hypothetical protein